MQFSPLILLPEWMCFITSIFLLRNLENKFWLIVKFYLFLTVFVESLSYYWSWFSKTSNQWLYNLFTPFEFTFGIWIILKIIYAPKHSKFLTPVFLTIYYSSYITELIFYKNIEIYFDKSILVGSASIIVLCIYYFYSLFQQEKYINLYQDASFWFISGLFIFYATSTGVDTFFEQFVNIRINGSVSLRYIIMNILNLILYGFWIRAFICLKIKEKFI